MNDRRLLRWQIITVVTLWIGYAGYYVCRSNLSVAHEQVIAELADEYKSQQDPSDYSSQKAFDEDAHKHGKKSLGLIFSAGVFFYAIGKFLNGVLGDFVGGRVLFLFGMVGSIICTVLFGVLHGVTFWVVIWSINRFVQSMGWVSLVKLSSRWFPVHRHGTVLGILSMSYLFGDALARLILGLLLKWGFGWRAMFFSAAAIFASIAAVSYFLLKSSPTEIGETEPEANPDNVFGQSGDAARPDSLLDLLRPFLSSVSFWLVCTMNFGLTLIRETFNNWNPKYLNEVVGLSGGDDGIASALFPFVGGLSALWAGVSTDRARKRSTVMIWYLVLLILATFLLAGSASFANDYSQTVRLVIALSLTAVTAFALIGPYSLLSGVCALDFGGKKGSATAAGVIDSVGYFGGALAGWGMIKIRVDYGWGAVFACLGVVAMLSLIVAVVYWFVHERKPNRPES